jgi:hypothetical protein
LEVDLAVKCTKLGEMVGYGVKAEVKYTYSFAKSPRSTFWQDAATLLRR